MALVFASKNDFLNVIQSIAKKQNAELEMRSHGERLARRHASIHKQIQLWTWNYHYQGPKNNSAYQISRNVFFRSLMKEQDRIISEGTENPKAYERYASCIPA